MEQRRAVQTNFFAKDKERLFLNVICGRMESVKEIELQRLAKFQKVRMDLEKGGGKNENHDYAEAYPYYDFEHKQ